jgi:hypothetical protein
VHPAQLLKRINHFQTMMEGTMMSSSLSTQANVFAESPTSLLISSKTGTVFTVQNV